LAALVIELRAEGGSLLSNDIISYQYPLESNDSLPQSDQKLAVLNKSINLLHACIARFRRFISFFPSIR
jgi:hypothetical protein